MTTTTTARPPLKCLRCGAEWTPRIEGRPKCCPSCKQTRWDVPSRYRKRAEVKP